MILDTTAKKLQVLLAGAVTTNELPVVVAYSELDAAGGTLTPSASDTATSGATPVDILAAPAASKQRVVDYLSVHNRDTASATVTIQMDVSGTARILKKATLAAGEALVYTRGSGWG